MEKLLQAIKSCDTDYILEWGTQLSDNLRYEFIEKLRKIKSEDLMDTKRPENYGDARRKYHEEETLRYGMLQFAILMCIRSKKDLKLVGDKELGKDWSQIHAFLLNAQTGVDPIIKYYKKYTPDYLPEIIEYWNKESQIGFNFTLLWTLYQNQLVDFNEEEFVRSLMIIHMFSRNLKDDIELMENNPEIIDKVLLQFYKYDLPVLDLSKWSLPDNTVVCERCTNYWDFVLDALVEKGLIKNQEQFISNLISTLAYAWKKGRIDWHIRLIKRLNPNNEDYINNQEVLYSAFSSTNSTVGTFIISIAEKIYKDKQFDREAFLQNIGSLFVKEKSDKAIQSALKILEEILTKDDVDKYSDTIAMGLIQPNDKIQIATAQLLKKLTSEDTLKAIITPYINNLKTATSEILNIVPGDVQDSTSAISSINIYPVTPPDNWEDLLFHIGKVISSQNSTDLDLLYEAFIQIQDKLPDGYEGQLKPYIKKLSKVYDKILLMYLSEFFENLISDSAEYKKNISSKKEYNFLSMEFLRNRNIWVYNKLKKNNKLPLLSTPTHYPFYVHPETLIDKILMYEKEESKVELEDLIIACNRVLKVDLSPEGKSKLQQIKGNYRQALNYLFGLTETIDTTDESLLPLWTQVTRTRNPEGIFHEFESTKAKNYPVVVHPFNIGFEIKRDYDKDDKKYYWDRIYFDLNWGTRSYKRKTLIEMYPHLFYYTAYNDNTIYWEVDYTIYKLSLTPHYADALLLCHIPETMKWNDANDFDWCQYPLQYLIENQIPVHHSGWIYIAFCLLFEKKVSRTLASEYIVLADQLGFLKEGYLADVIAQMITDIFAPVNRLVEYFNTESSLTIRHLQLKIAEKCIERLKEDQKPTGIKNIAAAYRELCRLLKQEENSQIIDKLKKMKL